MKEVKGVKEVKKNACRTWALLSRLCWLGPAPGQAAIPRENPSLFIAFTPFIPFMQIFDVTITANI